MAGLTQHIVNRECWEGAEDTGPERVVSGVVSCAPDAVGEPLARIVRAIEGEIIPRLMLAHGQPVTPPALAKDDGAAIPDPTAEDVAEFAQLILRHDEAAAPAYLESLRARGLSLESLCLGLLAPTARRLGDMWNEDLCDFTEVTVGLWRLHRMLRGLCSACPSLPVVHEVGRRALLASVPGEQHTFGISMVAEFFRRAGWDVFAAPPASKGELVDIVRREWLAVIGLSASCERHVDTLTGTIRDIRRASRHRSVGVIVGGALFVAHPELAALVGADATALDGRHATAQAESLLPVEARMN